MSFIDSLWPGLCYTPGFVLQSIKFALFSGIGLVFLIVPGVFLGLKHCLDPYYSIIGDRGSLYNSHYPLKKGDLKKIFIFTISFLPLVTVFNILPMVIDKLLNGGFIQYIMAPGSILLSLFTATGFYFYTEYVTRIERKSLD